MTPEGLLDLFEIERVRQALSDRDQFIQLGHARSLGLCRGIRGERDRATFLALSILVKHEHDTENDERGQQVEVVLLLHGADRVQHEAQRLLKHHRGPYDQTDRQRAVVVDVEKAEPGHARCSAIWLPEQCAETGRQLDWLRRLARTTVRLRTSVRTERP